MRHTVLYSAFSRQLVIMALAMAVAVMMWVAATALPGTMLSGTAFAHTSSTAVSVPANQPWTDTGIDIPAGAQVDITASGRIRIAGSDPGKNPDGTTFDEETPSDSCSGLDVANPNAQCWSLIGRIGTGTPFSVGYGTDFVATSGGRLFLGVNDDIFGDNSGAWPAVVTVSDTSDTTPPTSWTVNSIKDDGNGTCDTTKCTLRDAIAVASSGGTITFEDGLSGAITLAGHELYIDKNLTIEGPGADKLAVSGNNASKVFQIEGTNVSMSGLTIKGASGDYEGGGINNTGTLTLTDSTVSGNFAYDGGGIHNNGGTFKLINSTVSGNTTAFGRGGINNNSGTFELINSTVSGNTTGGWAGAIFNRGILTLEGSTVSDNTANETGGISNSGTLTLTNSTVSGNTAHQKFGGGIFNNGGAVTLTNSTIYNNSAPDGANLFNPGGVALENTIVASPQGSGQNCFKGWGGAITSEGNNLEDSNSCGFDPQNKNDWIDTNPLLEALADNGGQTQTHALQHGSPAIDKAAAVEGITTDQRGVPRPQGAGYDIGSYELEGSDTTPPTTTASATADGETYNPGDWTNKDVTVEFSASDEEGGSGVESITYKLTDKDGQTIDEKTVSDDNVSVPINSEGEFTISYYATDTAGNSGDPQTFTVKIDKTAPALNLPSDITREATGPDGAAVTFTAMATDDVDVACDPASGSTFDLGTTTVECSATDAAGNPATDSFTVTVVDTTKPSLTLPGTINKEAATGGVRVEFANEVSATDIVDGDIGVTCDPASGSTFDRGRTTVTCTATDSHNNTATDTFDVIVADNTDPVLQIPEGKTVEATGLNGASVDYEDEVSATDTADDSVEVSCTPESGSTFPLGTTRVDCEATDDAGNEATGSFDVTVQDTTAPAISGMSSDITKMATSASGAEVTYASPTATDVVDGSVSVSCTPASGSTFAVGTTTVTCSASDSRNNSASETFKITVTPYVPTSKEQCKKDGWKDFEDATGEPLFKNQGNCVSFVQTNGKNKPG